MPVPPIADPGSPHARRAAREFGCFYIPFPPEIIHRALTAARQFFSLPAAVKQTLAIENSPHFRGYSQMRNERDWREQIHFSTEEPPLPTGPAFNTLRGPNLWPSAPHWQAEIISLMAALEGAAREVLAGFGEYLAPADRPYLLLKLIQYHGGPPRPGVAPHVDFSWITLLIQDETGGLEIRTPYGDWLPAPHQPGTALVNVGEILQFATGGLFQATPHRVTTSARDRVSLPFFLNPPLDATISPTQSGEHIHRVLLPPPLHFGQEEWNRKGLGVWCASCC